MTSTVKLLVYIDDEIVDVMSQEWQHHAGTLPSLELPQYHLGICSLADGHESAEKALAMILKEEDERSTNQYAIMNVRLELQIIPKESQL